jgi:hypothetical protein
MIKICFDIQYQLFNDSDQQINFRKNLINPLSESIESNSRLNSSNKIISTKLGIIYLVEKKINIKNSDFLKFEFSVNLQNQIENTQQNIQENIEEIIWCIMPSTYNEDGILNFIVNGLSRIKNYT